VSKPLKGAKLVKTAWWKEGKWTPATKGKAKEQQRCDA